MADAVPGGYQSPGPLLAQGDIFALPLVVPFADTDQRLVRTVDGAHGERVFTAGQPAKIFDPGSLRTLLAHRRPTAHHVDPFCRSPSGLLEYVVTTGELVTTLMIATQTCDVAGQDGPPFPTTLVLPVRTVFEMCVREPIELPTDAGEIQITIHDYMIKYAGCEQLSQCVDVFKYPIELDALIEEWKPPKKSAMVHARSIIKNITGSWTRVQYLYGLREDPAFGVPRSFVDMTCCFSVDRALLEQVMDRRLVSLADGVRADFAHRYGHLLSRVALNKPQGPGRALGA